MSVKPHYIKFIWAGSSQFWMNGYENKQNCRFWDDKKSHDIKERSINTENNYSVWIVTWRRHRAMFEVGQALIVNDDHYISRVCNSFWSELIDLDDPTICSFIRTALRATHLMPQIIFYAKDLI